MTYLREYLPKRIIGHLIWGVPFVDRTVQRSIFCVRLCLFFSCFCEYVRLYTDKKRAESYLLLIKEIVTGFLATPDFVVEVEEEVVVETLLRT
jgi:hypothetical protein